MAKKINAGYDEDEDNSPLDTNKFIDSSGFFDKHDFETEDDEDEDSNDMLDDDDFYEKKTYIADPEDDDDAEEQVDAKQRKKRPNQKPKLIGKHSLSYDTIFKGKQNVATDEAEYQSEHFIKNAGGSLDINDSDLESEESRNNIDAYRDIRLKHEVHNLLKSNTDINFTANRRKPAKTDFNAYYALLLKEMTKYGYTRTEIFIELSGYFSDNIWNMFQLLEKQYSNIVIKELKDKYGLSDMAKIDFIT